MTEQTLRKVKFGKAIYSINKSKGYFPYFQFILRSRIRKKKAVNVAITGEAGEGKSYLAATLCRLIDPTFSVNQIVFRYSSYINLVNKLRMGKPILFDEPSYAMGRREWYKEVNQALVKTIESARFMVKPLFIPIINKALLDKTVRTYLLQFQVIVRDRGLGVAYRLEASQYEEKDYRHFICKLHYPLLDPCPQIYHSKNRMDCLGCRYLKKCPTFRAQYERKKKSIQQERYQQAERDAHQLESKDLTDSQIEAMLYGIHKEFMSENGKIDVDMMRIVAHDKLNLLIGHNKAYTMKKRLCYHHPELFHL